MPIPAKNNLLTAELQSESDSDSESESDIEDGGVVSSDVTRCEGETEVSDVGHDESVDEDDYQSLDDDWEWEVDEYESCSDELMEGGSSEESIESQGSHGSIHSEMHTSEDWNLNQDQDYGEMDAESADDHQSACIKEDERVYQVLFVEELVHLC
jgi:hypothetical protein